MRPYLIVGLYLAGVAAVVTPRLMSIRPTQIAVVAPAPVTVVAAPVPESSRGHRRLTREARLKLARLEDALAARARAEADAHEAKERAGRKAASARPPLSLHTFLSVPLSSASERRLGPRERAADLAPELFNAILRMEGIYDPTRIALVGPALRMMIRSGTAEMIDVSGLHWRRASFDPNIHTRVTYLAGAWYQPIARTCDDFWLFRPDDTAIALEQISPEQCRSLRIGRADAFDDPHLAPVVAAALSLPAFAAPYWPNRFSARDLVALRRSQIHAIKDALFFKSQPLRRRMPQSASSTARSRGGDRQKTALISSGSAASDEGRGGR